MKREVTSELIHSMIKESDSEMEEFINNAKSGCVCYGDSLMIHDALAELLEDEFNVKYIIDDTPTKQGRTVDGIEVVSRSDGKVCSEKYIIGTSSAVKHMRDNLGGGDSLYLCHFVNIQSGSIMMSVYM